MNSRYTCEEIARSRLGEPAKREGAELLYCCPHRERHKNGDAHPSLKVNPQKDVWGCFVCGVSGNAWALAAFIANCDPGDKRAVTAWLKEQGLVTGAKRKNKSNPVERRPVVGEFIHCDATGKPVCKKLRHEPGEGGKEKDYTWQCFERGKWKPGLGNPPIVPPLYRLPQIQNEPFVFLFESHTDVERAVMLGLPATTSGGANSWRPEYAYTLAGKDICLVPDNDQPGARYAATVCQSLHGEVRSLRVLSIAPHPDFRRWADAGGTIEQIFEIYKGATEYRPATGAGLLQRFEAQFNRYIIAPKGTGLTAGLYAMMTHCFEAFGWIGYLTFTSPLESCAKSISADTVGWASARPEILVSITQAALFRLITESKPTIVIDEAEILRGDDETAVGLRAVLHAGCAPDDGIIRCAPNTHKLDRFSPWCPKVFCMIGEVPRVLRSRCIVIPMERKKPSEKTAPFIRRRVKAEQNQLGAEFAAWIDAHKAEIQRAYESLPDSSFESRARENFAPLEAILSVADPGRLPELATARTALSGETMISSDAEGIYIRLLADIRELFTKECASEISSVKMCEGLAAFENSPWGTWARGKPINPSNLSKLLGRFRIKPDRIGPKGSQSRGYTLSQFLNAFEAYLPPENVNLSTSRENSGEEAVFDGVRQSPVDTLGNAVSPSKNKGGRHVDTLKPRINASEAEQGTLFADELEVEWEA
jgi:Protein of unknown function (DUF3631)/CHC2 zinc finger